MRILLARTGGLGDCLLTLPVAAELKRRFTDAEIDLLGNGMMCAVGRFSGLFSGVHAIDTIGFHDLFAFRVTPFLREFFTRYDRVYFYTAASFCDVWRTIRSAGAPHCRVLNPQPTGNPLRHVIDHLATIFEDIPDPHLSVRPFRFDHIANDGQRTLVMHPGSGGISKNWPLERYLDVAASFDGDVRFVLGPVEAEREDMFTDAIASSRFDARVCDAPEELAEVLMKAAVYLGNDSGAGHMAAMMGIPSVILFGPTDPRVWRPPGTNVRIVKSPNGAMDDITTDFVQSEITDILTVGV